MVLGENCVRHAICEEMTRKQQGLQPLAIATGGSEGKR